jgi:murein DD-endopeptidase MepM/ murein hydrolase activator NlpD
MKPKLKGFLAPIREYFTTFPEFTSIFASYLKSKIVILSVIFETNKNILVRFFMMKRGRYNRPFLHLSTLLVLTIGVIAAPFLASTYPVFSENTNSGNFGAPASQSIIVGENVFETKLSEKPRDKIISYEVQKGDTISTISQKFGVSVDTIKWANDLSSDYVSVGQQLDILPVTGIAYKVTRGDSIYTIAQRLDTDPQKIVDFPFNDFANPETFSLVEGQILIVPDGVKPAAQPTYRRQTYIAQGPSAPTAGGFSWPLRGVVSQFASWYHMAIDITSPIGTPVYAARSGVVKQVIVGSYDGGYGNNVYIDHGGGIVSHYAHLSSVNVSAGQTVVGGSTVIGGVGLTGRTTGPHLHFEINQNGSLINPLSYLQ